MEMKVGKRTFNKSDLEDFSVRNRVFWTLGSLKNFDCGDRVIRMNSFYKEIHYKLDKVYFDADHNLFRSDREHMFWSLKSMSP